MRGCGSASGTTAVTPAAAAAASVRDDGGDDDAWRRCMRRKKDRGSDQRRRHHASATSPVDCYDLLLSSRRCFLITTHTLKLYVKILQAYLLPYHLIR